jgi:hypothetical protein
MKVLAKMDLILEGFRAMVEELLLEAEPSLVPAIIHRPTGKIFKGEPGRYHHDIAEKNGFFQPKWKESNDFVLGFIDHKGHFLNRTRALDYAEKHDLLHDAAKKYLATDNAPLELGASFLKKPNQR